MRSFFCNLSLSGAWCKVIHSSVSRGFADMFEQAQSQDSSDQDAVRLTPLQSQHRAFYCQVYSDPALMQFIGEVRPLESLQRRFALTLKRMQSAPPQELVRVIEVPHSSQPAGLVGLIWRAGVTDVAEIGVIVCSHAQRTGLAHRAKRRLMQYAFSNLGVRRIEARCHPGNLAANRANAKLGFSRVGIEADSQRVLWAMHRPD